MSGRIIGLSYVLASVVLESGGQLALKRSAELNNFGRDMLPLLRAAVTDAWLMTGVACFLLEFVTWTLALHYLEVSLAYQLSCLAYITVGLSSRLWLSEQLGFSRWVGLFAIFAGSVLVGAS